MSKAKKKKGWLVGLTLLSAFILFILGIGYIPRFPLGPYKLYTDMTEMQKRSPLPIEVLSTEMLHPFTYTGSVAYRPEEHQAAKLKFDTVNNCLVRSERGKVKPDLRLLDWDALHSTLEVNICVWRIFNSLGSRDAAEKWVRFHGFKISQYQQLKPNVLVATYLVSGRGNLSTSGHRRALFPTRGYWKPYNHNLGVVWESSIKAGQIPKIIDVRFSSNML